MAPIPRLRAYEGPDFLSYGFRPLFLLAALQAGLTILVWLPFVTGRLSLPVAFGSYDKVTLLVTAAALLAWIPWPYEAATGTLLVLCAGCHALRLWRWSGERTWRNPLLLILHVAYAFVPASFLLTGLASFGLVPPAAGLHAWTAGAMAGWASPLGSALRTRPGTSTAQMNISAEMTTTMPEPSLIQ